jgi:putative tricarboxylic transport membrane protein
LAMIVLGLLLRIAGDDIETGLPRLTFGLSALEDGFSLLEIALGFFVIANVLDDLLRPVAERDTDAAVPGSPVRELWPAALVASLAGFLPTNGETFSTTAGARRARGRADLLDPASQSHAADILRAAMLSDIRLSVSLIPLFIWFAPVDGMTALLRGVASAQAVLTNAIVDRTPVAWLMGATLVLAHIVPAALVVGLPKVRWQPIRIDVRIVGPVLAIAACLVEWWVRDFDPSAVIIVLAFGLLGYALIRGGFDRHLMFVAFVVGAVLEENVRRSLLISRGDPLVYLERPISAVFLIAGVLILVIVRMRRGTMSAAPA